MLAAVPLAGFLASDAARGADADRQAAAGALRVARGGTTLPAGVYAVADDLTVGDDLLLLPGARIDVAAGRTLTLLGDFAAPAGHVFTGRGRVDLNRGRLLVARPEWWGAAPGDRSIDSLAALSACVAAHPVTALLAADYHVSDTWRITTPNRAIRGMTGFDGARTLISRIVLEDESRDIMQVGPDAAAGGPETFLPGIKLDGFELARGGRVRPVAANARFRAAAGLRVQYATACQFDNLTSMESGIGYAIRGVVRSFFRNCSAFRSRAGTARADDIWHGFYLDGSARFGMAGGNASLYLLECVASAPADAPLERSIGAYLPGAFADIFLVRFETAGLTHGIIADGVGGGGDRFATRWGNGDLHITQPILDDCGSTGIELVNLSPYALADIGDPYVATRPGAWAAIQVRDGGGQATIAGGQLIGWSDGDGGGNSIGINVLNASGVAVNGTKLLGYRKPIMLTNARDFDVAAAISNPDQRAAQAAVRLSGCRRGAIRVRVRGGAGVFPRGVELAGAANTHVAVDCTGIDPDAIAGGAANMLVANGIAIAAAGPFGANLSSGIMG